jgi:hypothetical protein
MNLSTANDSPEMSRWVSSDRMRLSISNPLLIRKRPSRCVAVTDAAGQEETFQLRWQLLDR